MARCGRITGPYITSAAQYLVLDYVVEAKGGITAAPSTMRIDYVRVWRR